MATVKQSGIANYLAMQIFQNKITYDSVISKYPAYKEIIDKKLNELNTIPVEYEK